MNSITPSLRQAKRHLEQALDTTNEAVNNAERNEPDLLAQHLRLIRQASFLATLHSTLVTLRFWIWYASEQFRRLGF